MRTTWRPAIGWICVVAFAFQFVVRPWLSWGAAIVGLPAVPGLESGDLMGAVGAALGIGGMRSVEKIRGVTQ